MYGSLEESPNNSLVFKAKLATYQRLDLASKTLMLCHNVVNRLFAASREPKVLKSALKLKIHGLERTRADLSAVSGCL